VVILICSFLVKNSLQLPTHLPPQAIELERAILGAAMIEQHATTHVLELLTEASFYQREHQLVFAAMRELATASAPIDQLTVVQQLRKAGVLERAGGVGFVAGLTMKINSGANIEAHCAIVREQHIKRVTQAAALALLQKCYDQSLDALELADEAVLAISQVQASYEQHSGATVADHFEAVFEKMRLDIARPGLTGVPTGLTELNDATGGWQAGDLIIIAARPSMGKTAKMLNAMRAACFDEEKYAAIFSLEMPAMQFMQRLVAAEVEGYSVSQLRRGDIVGGEAEVARIREASLRLKAYGNRVMVEDGSTLTIQQLRSKCLRLHQRHPLGLVMVDYIQLMEGPQKSKGANREQEIAAISRGLKKLAKELNVPVIALSQLSREVEKRADKRPQLSDLRESGAIEQDADLIMFLWRAEYYKIDEYEDGMPTAGTMLLDIKKNRNGKLGEVFVGCNLDRGLLYDLGTEPGTSAELHAAEDYHPRRIMASVSSQFEKGQPDPNDLPF
jgi:replicative DNA helicase